MIEKSVKSEIIVCESIMSLSEGDFTSSIVNNLEMYEAREQQINCDFTVVVMVSFALCTYRVHPSSI